MRFPGSALLLPYLRGATEITITDPYIRQFHQARNLMELIEALALVKDPADEVKVILVTSENTEGPEVPKADGVPAALLRWPISPHGRPAAR